MPGITADQLSKITSFPKLVSLLRDNLDWPIHKDYELEDVIYEYDPAELGLKPDEIAKIREISQLRPLVTNQPWGIFFISFEEKTISVSVLRRMLRNLVFNKRGSAKTSDKQAWAKNDLIFAANFGKSGKRELAFVHFSDEGATNDLPVLKVLGWNTNDTVPHNDYVSNMLNKKLRWPNDANDFSAWRAQWSSAFEIGHNEAIRTSKDLAIHLAVLATNIRARAKQLLKAESDKGPMQKMLAVFRKNLIQNLDEDGFADMFAQTISYGLLAAHISRPSGGIVADNLVDMVPKTNPFLRELFSTFLSLGGRDQRKGMDYDELGVRDVVDMLAAAKMDAVLRDFGNRNPKKDPVIHFYEDFLHEYDAEQKIDAGIFYTPPAVVNFIVRGVNEMLQSEFGLPLGLADTTTWGQLAAKNDKITIPSHIKPETPFVQILDPATGTGTFLVEAIDLIHKTMENRWRGEGRSEKAIVDAWNVYVPKHLLPRLTAFELKMAPYAIAHMKIGLKLQSTGYSFGSDERVHILLTNAMQPHLDLDYSLGFMKDAFAHEAERANAAKEEVPFTVVIGNPPYKGHSENPSKDKKGKLTYAGKLIQRFFTVRGEPLNEANPKWLNNDYVKFIAFATSLIEKSGAGVFGYITSNSWLESTTFRGMRTEIIATFPILRIVDLHGNINKKEIAPDGTRDEGVFAIEEGTNITIAGRLRSESSIRQIDRLGKVGEGADGGKLDWLENNTLSSVIIPIHPLPPIFRLTPMLSSRGKANPLLQEFYSIPSLQDIAPMNSAGIVTANDELCVQFSTSEMKQTVKQFIGFDLKSLLTERERRGGARKWKLEASANPVTIELKNKSEPRDWQVELAQSDLLSTGNWQAKIQKLAYRPFDVRTTVFTGKTRGFLCMPRAEVMNHMIGGENVAISSVRGTEIAGGWEHVFAFSELIQHHSVSLKEVNYLFPLWLKPSAGELTRRPNVELNFALSIGRAINLSYEDGIKRGQQGSFGADYRKSKPEQTSLLEAAWEGRGDLTKTFGPRDLFDWIYAVLHAPSYRGRYGEFLKSDFPRIPTPASRELFQKLAKLGHNLVALHLLKADEAPMLKNPDIRFAGSGEARVTRGYPDYQNGKVMINAMRWFEDVSRETWEFHVGGYQVCKKWLKDRASKGGANPSPGRVLTDEDILHYRRVVTSLTETRRLMADIDRTIVAHGGWPGAFKGMADV